ncbi:MAG: glycosyltransferase [Acidobacteriaceae bacterium]
MRILHVIGSLSPADGGPPEAVRHLARAYPKIGVDVEVLCQDPPDAPFLTALTFPVHALGQRWLGRFGLSPRFWRWLHRNAARFDGIVMNGLWIFPDIAVRAAARSAQRPYLVFAHGALSPWFEQYRLKHIKKMAYWPLQYAVLRDARCVLFTSAAEREQATLSFRPNQWRSACVPYGIIEPVGDPCAQREAFFAHMPSLRDRPFLLFLSRLVPVKGCDLLIDAFARIAREFPDVDLVMAGPDRVGWQAALQRQCAEAGIADRVHWPGMLSGDVKWGALRAADALVLPSHTENFGVAIVESLAAGRPVLISNKVNISPDILADGAGLIDDDTLEGTERVLRRWLAMPAIERAATSARARPCFANHYSMERTAAVIKALFSETEADSADAVIASIRQ